MSNQTNIFLALYGACLLSTSLHAAVIEEIIITADFRENTLMDSTTSISVVDQNAIQRRAADQLEEILNLAPNLNYSAGASRGRYLQIRGIGERSQFVDPVSPSVGLTIDGVDFSTMGNAATLFDVAQVDILRGPQGTKFGASAMAGLVNVQSNAPTSQSEGRIKAGMGNYGRQELGGVLSGPLADQIQARIAINQMSSDGYVYNRFLDRDDTNDRDELTARAKLNWQANAYTDVSVTYVHLDIDNGYDAFSLDNNRVTLSDEPGQDRQETDALSVQMNYRGFGAATLEFLAAYQNTDAEYGFDEDWTNTEICEGLECDSDLWGFDWWYSSADNYLRDYNANELGLRAVSEPGAEIFGNSSWVAGIYFKDTELDLHRDFFDWDLGAPGQFESTYQTTNRALYGEIETPLSDQLRLTVGGRVEDFDASYLDSRTVSSNPNETLWGGEITLQYDFNNRQMTYALISRGFKPGGVNGDALGNAEKNGFAPDIIQFLNQRLNYQTETATNYEIGARFTGDIMRLRLSAFYMQRDDVQLKGWYNEGALFVGYTDNGASGTNYGAEIELDIQASDQLQLFASVGLLETEIDNFYILGDSGLEDQSGREQAHAPGYQFHLGGQMQFSEQFSGRLDIEGKDSFYFSDSHDQQSQSYQLIHASINYQLDPFALQLWGRNLLDENYQVRGFYFANDPRDFYANDQSYTQLGDPRTFGVSATWSF